MQKELKFFNQQLIPEAFEMLENGNSIDETKRTLSNRIDSRFDKIFHYRLNYYVLKALRKKYAIIKNIIILFFILLIGAQMQERVLSFFQAPEQYNLFTKGFNLLLLAIFLNLVYQLYHWEGRYFRSVFFISIIFSITDFLQLQRDDLGPSFYFLVVLNIVTALLTFYLYKKIFPSHGIWGPPKPIENDYNVLDDFR